MKLDQSQKSVFDNEYMPYIIKWGKITCWVSIPLIFIPTVALMVFYGARPSMSGILTGFISLFSAMVAWYIVDPITLFPILHVPGMYLTYIAGNSKEIRAPAATAALSSADVEATVSIFISLAVMTLVAVAGNLILSILPDAIIRALNYLLPALFGAMCIQRIMADYRSAAIVVPCACVLRYLNTRGVFKVLPLGGGYALILLCVLIGVFVAKQMYNMKQKKAKAN